MCLTALHTGISSTTFSIHAQYCICILSPRSPFDVIAVIHNPAYI
uniref:Uncharacterized protein n=1 Tax=Anguilla anguilla TaxID=7936 RepID=A0A0E9SUI8_ANGAN